MGIFKPRSIKLTTDELLAPPPRIQDVQTAVTPTQQPAQRRVCCTFDGASAVDNKGRRAQLNDLKKQRSTLLDLKVAWSAYPSGSCDACWAMDGQVFTIEEAFAIEVSGSCRCTFLPHRDDWEKSRPNRNQARQAQRARYLAEREDLARLEREESQKAEILKTHYAMVQRVEELYKARKEGDEAMERFISACKDHIDWLTDKHEIVAEKRARIPTFEQLAIAYEQSGRLAEAISVCEQSKTLGASKDLSERLSRLNAKLTKGGK